jgi:cytochrome c
MKTHRLVAGGLLALVAVAGPVGAAPGDPERGRQLFRVCLACHTLLPGGHRTGPSLHGVWERKSGSVADFGRYSRALEQAGLVWDAETLDAWLANPGKLVPGTTMGFRGIESPQDRADLIAYLEQATSEPASSAATPERADHGLADLKQAPPAQVVQAIRRCGDSYRVTTRAGDEIVFWEFNLRFKTDTGPAGPHSGQPVLIASGMGGDRAQVVFSSPAEISPTIEERCGE